jgi:multicomponent Na+:H+ antiporter subunit C
VRILGLYNYWVFVFLMMVGFYILISRRNLIQEILGLTIFQTAVFIFYISMGSIAGAEPPFWCPVPRASSTPTLSPCPHPYGHRGGRFHHGGGLALVVRIKEAYGTIEGDEIADMDTAAES